MLLGIDASRTVTRQKTGTEAYAFFLISALLPLTADYGHRVRLYFRTPPPPDLFPAQEHVEVITLPLRRLWTHIRLGWELQRRPPDLFFTPAHVIPWGYHGLSVATVHDLGYHHFPAAHPRRQLVYLRWSTRHNGRRARAVLADSQATKSDLIHFDQIPEAKIHVVYPGLNPRLQREADPEELERVRVKYGLKRPYLLYISTLQPRKNVARLVRAYAQSGVAETLVLAGKSGWQAEPIMAEIDKLPASIAANIHLPGYIAAEDKAALISGAEALLYPSLYEGFGFPILEGQVCGVPVLTANTSSCAEVAGPAALLVDPENTEAITTGIRQLTKDEGLRQKLISAGYANVKRFSWAQAAGQVLRIFEEIVSAK